MTTPPKARRYRLSREESVVSNARDNATPGTEDRRVRVNVRKGQPEDLPGDSGDLPFAASTSDDGFGDIAFPGSAKAEAASAVGKDAADAPPRGKPADATPSLETRIAAVRAENLTGRQLRMARRIAAMHEIDVASDFEAVVILRERGIDPFHRAEVGKILSTEGNRVQRESAGVPMYVPGPAMPSRLPNREIGTDKIAPPDREPLSEERRASEILKIQQDLARRRRRRMFMLFARLLVFVGFPTIMAGIYYYKFATPLYATVSQFLIQQADSSSTGGGGLFGGTQAALNPDSVSVQSYLTSRDAMLRLDTDLGFKKVFQDPAIDPIQRLAPDATNEQTYKVYKNSVKIGYDPTEGVLNMEVKAPDPKLSQDFSLALIQYAEGQVDQMTARLRSDQMEGAIQNYKDAEDQVRQAQAKVLELQEVLGVLDPAAEGSVVMTQISELERQLSAKRLELGQLMANANPNASRVAGVQGDIKRLEAMLDETRARLTEGSAARGSLAATTGQIRIAESELTTRQQLLADAAANMETARIEANKQVRYLSLSVAPVPPDEAAYPKAFQNTLVAFLIFAGIYLMLSLTASILREQVSS